jgi:6-phosphogluconolactonase
MDDAHGQIEVLADPQALARRAAEWMTATALAAGTPCRIALSGGSTPKALYALLASDGFRNKFPWEKCEWYWGDERFVPHDSPDSNYRMAREAMLGKVPVPAGKMFPIPTDGAPEEAALRYEQTLQKAYGSRIIDRARPLFDIQLLGMGEDGHTASLLPNDTALEEQNRWVLAIAHGRPEVRITMTLPVIESSRHVLFLVAGSAKAPVLAQIRAGGSVLPAARVNPVGELLWLVDRAAASAKSP